MTLTTVHATATLLRHSRNRIWQQRILTRLNWGCYLSAGIALLLAAVHLGFISVPKILWWFAITLPIAGYTAYAMVVERPSLTVTAGIADGWFATDELLTSAHYATQLVPDQSNQSVLHQLGTTADTIAARLLQQPSVYPALTVDPRITIALLLIALSAFVTLTAIQPESAQQAVMQGLEHSKPTIEVNKSWLILHAPEAANSVGASTRGDTRAVEAKMQTTLEPAEPGLAKTPSPSLPPTAIGDSEPTADQAMQYRTAQSAHAAAGSTTGSLAGAKSLSDMATSQQASAHTSDAIDRNGHATGALAQTQAGGERRTILADPEIRVSHYELQRKSLQISAQPGQDTMSKPTYPDTLSASATQKLQVIAHQTSQLPQIGTDDMAQQLLGPVARTLAVEYSESQRQ